jgi:hypothetical protein
MSKNINPSACFTPSSLPVAAPIKSIRSNSAQSVTIRYRNGKIHVANFAAGETRPIACAGINSATGAPADLELYVYDETKLP